jgi:hypothetical protein
LTYHAFKARGQSARCSIMGRWCFWHIRGNACIYASLQECPACCCVHQHPPTPSEAPSGCLAAAAAAAVALLPLVV